MGGLNKPQRVFSTYFSTSAKASGKPPTPDSSSRHGPNRDSRKGGYIRDYITRNFVKFPQEPSLLEAPTRSDHIAGTEIDPPFRDTTNLPFPPLCITNIPSGALTRREGAISQMHRMRKAGELPFKSPCRSSHNYHLSPATSNEVLFQTIGSQLHLLNISEI